MILNELSNLESPAKGIQTVECWKVKLKRMRRGMLGGKWWRFGFEEGCVLRNVGKGVCKIGLD